MAGMQNLYFTAVFFGIASLFFGGGPFMNLILELKSTQLLWILKAVKTMESWIAWWFSDCLWRKKSAGMTGWGKDKSGLQDAVCSIFLRLLFCCCPSLTTEWLWHLAKKPELSKLCLLDSETVRILWDNVVNSYELSSNLNLLWIT